MQSEFYQPANIASPIFQPVQNKRRRLVAESRPLNCNTTWNANSIQTQAKLVFLSFETKYLTPKVGLHTN